MGLRRGRVYMSEKSMRGVLARFPPLRSSTAQDTVRVLQSAFGVPWQLVRSLKIVWRERCTDAEAVASGAYLPRAIMYFHKDASPGDNQSIKFCACSWEMERMS